MNYDFPPYRPPSEANSILIRASRGCPWNRCAFCTMYKDMRFEKRPLEDIKRDIDGARKIFGSRRTVFIADSDSLLLPYIADVASHIRKVFPEAERVTSYARARTLARLGPDRLKKIKEAGLSRLHVGLESGDPKVLELLCKGATPGHYAAAADAAHEAGLELSLYVLVGGGGEEKWKQHAKGSAEVINRCQPDFVRLRTLVVQKDAPLWTLMEKGDFTIARAMTLLRETELLVRELKVSDCHLTSDHVTNYLHLDGIAVYRGVDGMLPRDRKAMLEHLQDTINDLEGKEEQLIGPNDLHRMGHMVGL